MNQVAREAGAAPASWLVPAILTTLCCMPITGVIAVYYAAQVASTWGYGDTARAVWLARRARLWTILGLVFFLVLTALAVASGQGFTFVDRLRG